MAAETLDAASKSYLVTSGIPQAINASISAVLARQPPNGLAYFIDVLASRADRLSPSSAELLSAFETSTRSTIVAEEARKFAKLLAKMKQLLLSKSLADAADPSMPALQIPPSLGAAAFDAALEWASGVSTLLLTAPPVIVRTSALLAGAEAAFLAQRTARGQLPPEAHPPLGASTGSPAATSAVVAAGAAKEEKEKPKAKQSGDSDDEARAKKGKGKPALFSSETLKKRAADGLDSIFPGKRHFWRPGYVPEVSFKDALDAIRLGCGDPSVVYWLCTRCEPKRVVSDPVDAHLAAKHPGVPSITRQKVTMQTIIDLAGEFVDHVEDDGAARTIAYRVGFQLSRLHSSTVREDGSAFEFLNMLLLKSSMRRSPCSIAGPIHVYTMDTEVYRVMNRAMREDDRRVLEMYRPFIWYLTEVVNAMQSYEGSAYRGIATQVDPTLYKPGNVITWQAFSSATTEAVVAKDFLGMDEKQSSTLFMISAMFAKSLREFSVFPSEAEVIFPPNSQFRIRSKMSQASKELLEQNLKRPMQCVEIYEMDEVDLRTYGGVLKALTREERTKPSTAQKLIPLLESHMDHTTEVSCRDARRNTPLHHAAREGNVTMLQMLLAKGDRVNGDDIKTLSGKLPLHKAVKLSGNDTVVSMLLSAKADPNVADGKGRTPLYLAADVPGNTKTVKALLERKASTQQYGDRDRLRDWSPVLHKLAVANIDAVIDYLDADGNATETAARLDSEGLPALYYACSNPLLTGHILDRLLPVRISSSTAASIAATAAPPKPSATAAAAAASQAKASKEKEAAAAAAGAGAAAGAPAGQGPAQAQAQAQGEAGQGAPQPSGAAPAPAQGAELEAPAQQKQGTATPGAATGGGAGNPQAQGGDSARQQGGQAGPAASGSAPPVRAAPVVVPAASVARDYSFDITVADRQEQQRRTALHNLCANRNVNDDLLQRLVYAVTTASTFAASCEDASGRTPLHYLVVNPVVRSAETLSIVLDAIEPRARIGHPAKRDGATPLHDACGEAVLPPKALEALLKATPQPSARDMQQRTPLHRLCESKLRDATMFVEQLEVMLADPRVDLKAEDHLGRKPLHVLCMNVYAPVLAINRLMDRTPLDTLTHADHVVMPDGSIRPAAAAASSPVRPTSGGRTPLHYLAENVALAQDTMYSSVVNLFSAKLAAGDVARGDAAKDTPLHIACRVNASMTLISFLLEHCKCPPGGCTPMCAVALRNSEELQPLHVACLNKATSVELITQLLARRADLVNSPGASNYTALHYACMGNPRTEFLRPEDEGLAPRRIQYSKVEVISALLRRGALVETPPAATGEASEAAASRATPLGQGPLHLACADGNLAAASRLLEHLALQRSAGELPVLRTADENGKTPFHLAAAGGWQEVLELLLRYDPELLNAKAPGEDHTFGQMALLDAAAAGKTVAVVFLLEQRVSVEAVRGETAVMKAAQFDRVEVLELIMSDPRNAKRLLNAEREDGQTALHLAVAAGRLQIVRGLIAHKADLTVQTDKGLTALHMAAANGQTSILQVILRDSRSAEIINLQTGDGATALHLAIEYYASLSADTRTAEAVTLIKDSKGCNTAVCNNAGYTPIGLAAELGLSDIVTRLIDQPGADMCLPTSGDTILHIAARQARADVVEFLRTRKAAACGEQNAKGDTPLLTAMRVLTDPDCTPSKREEIDRIVRALLEVRAPIERTADTNDTVVHLALRTRAAGIAWAAIQRLRESPETSSVLVQPNSAGDTLLMTACASGDVHAVSALINLPDVKNNLEAANDLGVTAFAAAVGCDAPAGVADQIAVTLLECGVNPAVQYASSSTSSLALPLLDGSPLIAIAIRRRLTRTVRALLSACVAAAAVPHQGSPHTHTHTTTQPPTSPAVPVAHTSTADLVGAAGAPNSSSATRVAQLPDAERRSSNTMMTVLHEALRPAGRATYGPHGAFMRELADQTLPCRQCRSTGATPVGTNPRPEGTAVRVPPKSQAMRDKIQNACGFADDMDTCWDKTAVMVSAYSGSGTVRLRFDHSGNSWWYPGEILLELGKLSASSAIPQRMWVSSLTDGSEGETPFAVCEQCFGWSPPDIKHLLAALQVRSVPAEEALEARDSVGMTPLMCAAMADLPDHVKALAKEGADLLATNAKGRNALMCAVLAGASSAAAALLDLVGDAAARSSPLARTQRVAMLSRAGAVGETALSLALRPAELVTDEVSPNEFARCITSEVFARLRDTMAEVGCDVYRANDAGVTPLVRALQAGRFSLAMALANADADVKESASSTGLYAAHVLCQLSRGSVQVQMVKVQGRWWKCASCNGVYGPEQVRVQQGDKVECDECARCRIEPDSARLLSSLIKRTPVCIDHEDDAGGSPVVYAARAGSIELLRVLVAADASLAVLDTETKQPLLLAAIERGDTAVATALVELGAPLDAITIKGETALELAARKHSAATPDLVSLLLRKGADVHTIGQGGVTPLHLVCAWPDIPAALRVASEMLGEREHRRDKGGLDVTVVDSEGYSALDVATRHGDAASELVERILQCRPSPPLNSTGADGLRPLHRCIAQGAPQLTSLLLAAGASPEGAVLELLTRATTNGTTPNWELLVVLAGTNVSLHATTPQGESALVLAARLGAPRAVMRALLGAPGIVLDLYGTKGETALLAALREGHLDTAFELLCVGASVYFAASASLPETAVCKGMKEAEGRTPLMYLADVRPPAAASTLRVRPLPDAKVACSHCKKDAADPLRAPVMWVGDGDAPVCASCRIACHIPDIVQALGGGPTAWVEVPVSGHGVPPPPQNTTLPAGEYPTLEAAQIAAVIFAPTCGPLAIWLDTRSPGPAGFVLRPAMPSAYPGIVAAAPAGAPTAAAVGRTWWAVSAPELPVLNMRSATGRTALHYTLDRASHALCAETARRLVRCGASINIAVAGGATPFVRALTLRDAEVDRETPAGGGVAAVVGMRSHEVVVVMVDRALAACRGNATELGHWLGLDAVDADGVPPLHALLRSSIPKRASRVAMLLDDCHASADVVNTRTGANALHVTAGETADDVVELIQRLHKASTAPFPLLNGVDHAGATPIHIAARVCNVAAVEALATLGARIDTLLPDGMSPFDVAMAGGDAGMRVAEKLFRFACAEPDMGGRRLKALWAMALGNQDTVRVCLGQSGRRGASEDQADVRRYLLERANGESLLMSAALAMGKRVPPALFESVWKAMFASLSSEELLLELKLRQPSTGSTIFHLLAASGARESTALILRTLAETGVPTLVVDERDLRGNHSALIAAQRAFTRQDRCLHYLSFLLDLVFAGGPGSASHCNDDGKSVLSLLILHATTGDFYVREAEEVAVRILQRTDEVALPTRGVPTKADAAAAAAGLKTFDVDATLGDRNTLLGLACKGKSVRLVQELLKRRATVDFQTRPEDPISPLHVAAQAGSLELAGLMLAAAKDSPGSLVDAGLPLLACAIQAGHDPVACAVIKAMPEAGKLLKDVADKDSMLVQALGSRLYQTSLLILTQCPELATRAESHPPNRTPLMLVCGVAGAGVSDQKLALRRKTGVCSVCHIKRGKNMYVSRQLRSFMVCEVCHNWVTSADIARELLRRGAKANVTDALDMTALHYAARNGREDIVTELLRAKADASALDAMSRSALSHAVEMSRPLSLVRVLVKEAGAVVSQADVMGRTPLHLALDIAVGGGEKGELALQHLAAMLEAEGLQSNATPPRPIKSGLTFSGLFCCIRSGAPVWVAASGQRGVVESLDMSEGTCSVKLADGSIVRPSALTEPREVEMLRMPIPTIATPRIPKIGDRVAASLGGKFTVGQLGRIERDLDSDMDVRVQWQEGSSWARLKPPSWDVVFAPMPLLHRICALALGTSAVAPALVECTAKLLRRHELCDFSEVFGSSPLGAALAAGNTTVARMLLHAGAQVGQINFSTLMPSADGLALLLNESSGGLLPSSVVDLHAVFRAGRRDLLTQLIPWLNGLPPSQAKQVVEASSSSVLLAAMEGAPHTTSALLALGISPNMGSPHPLVAALTTGPAGVRLGNLKALMAVPELDLTAGGASPCPLVLALPHHALFQTLAAALPPSSPQMAAAVQAAAASGNFTACEALVHRCEDAADSAITPAVIADAALAAAKGGYLSVANVLVDHHPPSRAPVVAASLEAGHFHVAVAQLAHLSFADLRGLRCSGVPVVVVAARELRLDVLKSVADVSTDAVLDAGDDGTTTAIDVFATAGQCAPLRHVVGGLADHLKAPERLHELAAGAAWQLIAAGVPTRLVEMALPQWSLSQLLGKAAEKKGAVSSDLLLKYIAKCDAASVEELLRAGVPKTAPEGKQPLLHSVVSANALGVLNVLLAANAPTDLVDAEGDPLLVKALKAKRYALVRTILASPRATPALANQQDSNGNTALFFATDVGVMRALIAVGADPSVRNKAGGSVLARLSADGVALRALPAGVALSTMLLDNSAAGSTVASSDFQEGCKVRVKPDVQPRTGWGSATHASVGVVTSLRPPYMSIDFPEHSGWSGHYDDMERVDVAPLPPLMSALAGQRVLDVDFILSHPDIRAQMPAVIAEWGQKMMTKAVEMDSVALCKLLVRHGVSFDFSYTPPKKPSAKEEPAPWPLLLWALKAPLPNAARVLIAEGPPAMVAEALCRPGPAGEFATMFATSPAHVIELVAAGANPSAVDGKGRPAVFHLILKGISVPDLPLALRWEKLLQGMYSGVVGGAGGAEVVEGSEVRVRPGVSPSYGWGSVTYESVGVVTSLRGTEDCIVDFPNHKSWYGKRSEMECVNAASAGGDGNEVSLLHLAATKDDVASATVLLSVGVPATVQTTSGESALTTAVKSSAWGVTRLLLQGGATLQPDDLLAVARARSPEGATACGARIVETGSTTLQTFRLSDGGTAVPMAPHCILELEGVAPIKEGRWYYEVEVQDEPDALQIGWAVSSTYTPRDTSNGAGDLPASWGGDLKRNMMFSCGSSSGFMESGRLSKGGVVGVGYDSETGDMWFSLNGTRHPNAATGVKPAEGLVPAVSRFSEGTRMRVSWGKHKHRPPDHLPIAALDPAQFVGRVAPAREIAVELPHVCLDSLGFGSSSKVAFELSVGEGLTAADRIRVGLCDASFEPTWDYGCGDVAASWGFDLTGKSWVVGGDSSPLSKLAVGSGDVVTVLFDAAAAKVSILVNGIECGPPQVEVSAPEGLVPCVSRFGSSVPLTLRLEGLAYSRDGYDPAMAACRRRLVSARRVKAVVARRGEWWTREGEDASRWHRANGDVYRGFWRDAIRHGEGSLQMANGATYVGDFADDRPHGQAVLRLPTGVEYKGKFDKCLRRGAGTETIPRLVLADDTCVSIGVSIRASEDTMGEFVSWGPTAFVVPGAGVGKYVAMLEWREVGWGGHSGLVRLALLRDGELVCTMPLGGGYAPHTSASRADTFHSASCALLAMARERDVIVWQYAVGRGAERGAERGVELHMTMNAIVYYNVAASSEVFTGDWYGGRRSIGQLKMPGAKPIRSAYFGGEMRVQLAIPDEREMPLVALCGSAMVEKTLAKPEYFEVKVVSVEANASLQVGFLHLPGGSKASNRSMMREVPPRWGATSWGVEVTTGQVMHRGESVTVPDMFERLRSGDVLGVGVRPDGTMWVALNGGAQVQVFSPTHPAGTLRSAPVKGSLFPVVVRSSQLMATVVWAGFKHCPADHSAIGPLL